MIASRQVEILFYRGIGRQRGRSFGALAQVIGRTTFPFLREYIVPAAKRVGTDMLEFAVPEIADVVSGPKNFKATAKSVDDKFWEYYWAVVAREAVRAESLQQKFQNKPIGRERTFLPTFLIHHVE